MATVPPAAEGRGEHRLLCSRLPDGRPALIANIDVDTHPVGPDPTPHADQPHAELLERAGWAPWPRAPRVVGWTDPARTTVVTMLGDWAFPGDPRWWDLVREHREVAVLVLLDRHVDAWGRAASYAEIAAWLDGAAAYAGLCEVVGVRRVSRS